jgi:hypothetical protein
MSESTQKSLISEAYIPEFDGMVSGSNTGLIDHHRAIVLSKGFMWPGWDANLNSLIECR